MVQSATTPMESRDPVEDWIHDAAHLLPSQGPITVFVHHNTLHAFEEAGFYDGVLEGRRVFGCEPFLDEQSYRQKLSDGRIRIADLEAVLLDDLQENADGLIATLGTRFSLRLAMLRHPFHSQTDAELRWLLAETDLLTRFRPEVDSAVSNRLLHDTRTWLQKKCEDDLISELALSTETQRMLDCRSMERWDEDRWEQITLALLWDITRDRVGRLNPADYAPEQTDAEPDVRHHRNNLLQLTGEDPDELVHDVLIRFCSTFLDQGFASWKLPERNAGMFHSFLRLYATPWSAPTRWLSGLQQECQRLLNAEISPAASVRESLEQLGVPRATQAEFVKASLLSLRGWAGMIWQMETAAEWAPHPAASGSLTEFLAIRLILDRLALSWLDERENGGTGDLPELWNRELPQQHCEEEAAGPDHLAFDIFQLAQFRGWEPAALLQLNTEQWKLLAREVRAFQELQRQRIYHMAFERRYRNQALDAVAAHCAHRNARTAELSRHRPSRLTARPAFQLVTCIDDREESLRRHVEEIDPPGETFGVAGFFGVAMYYRGAGDAHYTPLCPVNIKPVHFVNEEPLYSLELASRRRAEARRRLGRARHHAHVGTRTFLGGLLTGLFGSLAAFPLVARILFPRTTARIRSLFGHIVSPPATQLRIERIADEPGRRYDELGYSLDEMAAIVEGTLRAMGLTGNWSRVIAFCGHGSSSVNNPHESAYNCGACSGSRGGPNARAFAQMANDFRVRDRLAAHGLKLPEDTFFIGGYHNTCNDSVQFYDLERLPPTHRPDFERMVAAINEARLRNAHERCRRFESAELQISPADALKHVETRSEDLSQVRPEYNHATNSLCFVGRREWSRGLFLDRRAFLASYDPSQDDGDSSVLAGILSAVIPVCAGISLEYYFSTVDTEGYGCGSKLPHNITSLLGVMTGAASDLRPGLSAQMVEIHEPLRILFVVETTAEAMQRIIDANPTIARLVLGEWVQLAVLNADTSQIQLFHNGEFRPYEPESNHLPEVTASADWYRNRRDHPGFATIRDE
ncbi:MAG: DUF2309 domain-containing protein [Planctomycetaceae bacterium]|nr:DUF2309 domain-containing protein [Planctomycetaceae bacterium]